MARLDEIISGLLCHPVFEIVYCTAGYEAAVQALTDWYSLDDGEIRSLRDIVERTIKRT